MSGHSKWHNIQQKKGKTDAARANIFTKIGREIAVAVKDGGADPNSNSKLAQVIAKAKDNNMPNDNIMRSIKKASGELGSINYEDMTYEGYGVGGTAIIVEALTDNKTVRQATSDTFLTSLAALWAQPVAFHLCSNAAASSPLQKRTSRKTIL